VLKATDVAYVTDRRQNVFNRGALRYCGGPLDLCVGRLETLKIDKYSTDL